MVCNFFLASRSLVRSIEKSLRKSFWFGQYFHGDHTCFLELYYKTSQYLFSGSWSNQDFHFAMASALDLNENKKKKH